MRLVRFNYAQVGSADYIFTELYNIYPKIKISMEKLEKILINC